MLSGSFVGSIHEDVLNANPIDDESKRRLMDELKNRAKGSLSTRNYPEAVKLYSKGIEMNIDNAVLYSNRSMCYHNLGSFLEALSDAESSISCDPSYAKAFYRKGVALISLKQFETAIEAFQKGLMLVPNDKDFLAQLEKTKKLSQVSMSPPPPPSSSSSSSKDSTYSKASSSLPPPSTTTTPKGEGSVKVAEDAVQDEELRAFELRGYKKTADGKVTTYFHKDMDADTKALIGDIAPKRIESVSATVVPATASEGSVWNSAGTWEEKVFTVWATQRLTELLKVVSTTMGEFFVSVQEVKSVEGDAQITMMRGRRKHIYDFKVELDWTVRHGGRETSGNIIISDITGDEEYEFQVEGARNLPTELLRLPDSGLQFALRAALSAFCVEFKSK